MSYVNLCLTKSINHVIDLLNCYYAFLPQPDINKSIAQCMSEQDYQRRLKSRALLFSEPTTIFIEKHKPYLKQQVQTYDVINQLIRFNCA